MRKFVVTDINDNSFIFVFEDDKLTGIHASAKENESLLGNIYIGRVQNIVNNINAAFVEISKDLVCFYSLVENKKHIFLNRKNTEKLCVGDLILVQVSKEALKTKQPSVTSNISFSGDFAAVSFDGGNQVAVSNKIKDAEKKENLRNLALASKADVCSLEELLGIVPADYSIIVRTAAENADENVIKAEFDSLNKLALDIRNKAVCRPAFTCLYNKDNSIIADIKNLKPGNEDQIVTDVEEYFDKLNSEEVLEKNSIKMYNDKLLPLKKLYSLETHIEDALKKRVWLKSGAYLVIEPTEALTVIDVNTGKYDGNKKDRQQTFLNINLEAAKEIVRQLSIRNISGIIVIDFINMTNISDKEKLVKYVEELISKDPVPTFFIDITGLDLIEITRKKIKKPLYEIVRGNTNE